MLVPEEYPTSSCRSSGFVIRYADLNAAAESVAKFGPWRMKLSDTNTGKL